MWTHSNRKVAVVAALLFIGIQLKLLSWAVSAPSPEVKGFASSKAAVNTGDQGPPTLFRHYTRGGIKSGLTPTSNGFLLNEKPYQIISGAVHYFRVHPAYWRDRLRKMRAAGITTLETYVAWNLHEPEKDAFDFGRGSNDMSAFLDLVSYIKMAQEEDLLVILRPGPYICSEWDFGGLPSWLLRDPTMRVRTSYTPYLERVDRFLEELIPLVTDLQFTSASNGPIIAVQVENEYGAFGYDDDPRDKRYLNHLADKIKELGIRELLFTSDSPTATLDWGAVPGALQTANLQNGAAKEFKALRELQPNMPLMVTEFWSGWFDHWTEEFHSVFKLEDFKKSFAEILNAGASVSFYMFHGGTNFGFMNGANSRKEYPNYLPDVTSYDYDAPLSESGDYTPKYHAIAEMISSTVGGTSLRLPERPSETLKKRYAPIPVKSFITFDGIIDQVPQTLIVLSNTTLPMEELPTNDMNGQSYGFIVYRKSVLLSNSSSLKVRGHVRDFAQVLVDGELQTPPIQSSNELGMFGSWYPRDSSFRFGSWRTLSVEPKHSIMDIVVENMGRVNYGKPHHFIQKKGLWEGPVLLDGVELFDWEIISLEFKSGWVRKLRNWKPIAHRPLNRPGPVLLRAELDIEESPADTFIDMAGWGKGIVFVNGFHLGRYWSVGPQQTLYIPAPLLNVGANEILIYEQYYPGTKVRFSAQPKLGKTRS